MRKHYLQQAFSSDNGNGELAIRHDLEWHAPSARQKPRFSMPLLESSAILQ